MQFGSRHKRPILSRTDSHTHTKQDLRILSNESVTVKEIIYELNDSVVFYVSNLNGLHWA